MILFLAAFGPRPAGSTAVFLVASESATESTAQEQTELSLIRTMTELEGVDMIDFSVVPEPSQLSDVKSRVYIVPFYSQFKDISAPDWQKVGCGIASLAMLIDFYTEDSIESVDSLLGRGIGTNAFLDSAGWTHQGLINLAARYNLTGQSVSLSHLGQAGALAELEAVVATGPVMVSVHYTFEPTNPIPHLAVVNGIKDGQVYYNDPAESTGGGVLPVDKFLRAWKQRYIAIRPA